MRLDERVVVIVGTRSDIAQACSRRLQDEGAVVIAVDDSDLAVSPMAGTGRADHFIADVESAEGARSVAAYCVDRWGRLDVLFYAASAIDAAAQDSPVGLPKRSDWDRVYTRNVWGPMVYGRTLLPLLGATGGSVIFLTSIDGILGNPTIPAFSTSKGALGILTHVLAHDAGAHGVRVNAVATAVLGQFAPGDPGPLIQPGAVDKVIAATPVGRPPTLENIAGVVAFFASDDSAYVTGTVLPIDGGRTAVTPGTLRPRYLP